MSDYLDLKVDGNGYSDEILIHFDPNATEGFDAAYDAYKMGGLAAAPQLYSILPNENLTINTLPDVNVHPVIKLGFTAGVNGEYVITTTGLESFTGGVDLYLEDLLTNRIQDLNANPVYTFTAAPGQAEHRFNLHFAPVGIKEATNNTLNIYSNDKVIYVNITEAMEGDIIVYNLLGIEVGRKQIIGNTLNKLELNLNTGYYIVKVLGNTKSISNKVFIR